MPTKNIIAIGGGGFYRDPTNLALERYILDQSKQAKPKVCFIPTASGEAQEYIVAYYNAFTKLGTTPTHLSLFKPHTADLKNFLLSQDVIFVGGGNTKSMLALWREWQLDKIIREAWEQGIVLAGVSAGAICWFEQGSTDSIPGDFTMLPCLGFLPGSACPHYDGEVNRRPNLHRLLSEKKIKPGIAIEDLAAAHFVDQKLERVVSLKPTARAYHMSFQEKVLEEAIEPEVLTTYLPK